MRPGDLRHRITLQQKVETRDEFGGVTETWQDVATIHAAIEPLKGREFFAAQQVQADTTGRIRIRYREGVVPAMRAKFGARVYDLQSVINVDERNRELHLLVREVIG